MGRKIQVIFSFFALAILALLIYRLTRGQWTVINWGMLGVSALLCLLVFINFVYVFTFSYALAAIINGSLIFLALPSTASALLGTVAVLYGLRLAAFTWSRNHSSSYASKVDNIVMGHKAIPLGVKLSLWFMCTCLQTFHLMSVYFVAQRGVLSIGVLAGATTMLIGLLIEAVADAQKQRVKSVSVDSFISDGLFSRIRHPNYLGEILVQAGLVVAGVASVAAWSEFAAVLLSPAYIILLMIAEARRVDHVQRVRYGSDTLYQQWRGQSGALLPRP